MHDAGCSLSPIVVQNVGGVSWRVVDAEARISVVMAVRIAGGAWRGRQVRVPKQGVRPTSARAREALYSMLAARGVGPGGVWVDAFAGSGAVGLEALSRGADFVVFADLDGRRLASIKAFLAAQAALSRAALVRAELPRHVGRLQAALQGRLANVVFLDPPYAQTDLATDTFARTPQAWGPHLAADAILVCERASRLTAPYMPGWHALTSRRYGRATFDLWTLADGALDSGV